VASWPVGVPSQAKLLKQQVSNDLVEVIVIVCVPRVDSWMGRLRSA
jgi:hypothetical protein